MRAGYHTMGGPVEDERGSHGPKLAAPESHSRCSLSARKMSLNESNRSPDIDVGA